MEELSDETLLDLYFAGNAEAFRHFYGRHQGRVVAYGMSKGLSLEAAKDAAQETFLRLHRNIHRYERGRPALPWFFTITHRCVVDALRSRTLTAELPANLEAPKQPPSDPNAILAHLPVEQEQVVRLRVLEDLTFKEIAATTGKTEGALRKIFERARAKLRLALRGEES